MPFSQGALRFALVTAALSALCVVSASAACLGAGTVTAGGLRLREEAGTECKILTTAAEGEHVVVLEQAQEGWFHVDFKGCKGYMSADYIEVSAKSDAALGSGVVDTDGATLNVRSGPGTDYERVGVLEKDEVVTIQGVDNGWFKIKKGDLTGYVSSDYMSTCDNAGSTSSDWSAGQQVVAYAQQFLGSPYVWGGNGPNSFDCSGFTKYVYGHFGVSLNRTASGQLQNGVSVSRSDLRPGDLVFFDNGRVSTPVSHVGIYVGNGNFIHASTNSYAVQYNSLYSGTYDRQFVYARRIF